MPGPIVHLIVQQRMSEHLLGHGARGHELAALLDADPCSPYTGFGSMGPDFLFFSLAEYGTPLDELVNFVFSVYDALEPLIEFFEAVIAPVETAIDDAIAALDQALFQGLFGQIKDTAELLTTTALTAVGAIVTSQVDLFYPFYPKLQQGAPEKEWYWFDFLHYRRTGRFASEMWNLAGGDDDLRRYVLGYVSHIATDVVGHPYVNSVTGGPFRTHWHRHKLVENWIDAYARNRYRDSAQIIGCLNVGAADTYLPDAISGSYYSRLTELPGGSLPNNLSDMFVQAMNTVYSGIDHPPMLTAADVDTTYRLWLKWFTRSTSIGSGVPPTPVPPPGSGVISLVNDYVNGFPSPPGGGGGGGGGFSVLDILAALFALAAWLAEVLLYTLEWIISHVVDILTLPYTEAIGLIKWLLYQVQKGVFEVYDTLRFILVLGAYLFPEPRDLPKLPWGLALLNPGLAHLTGGAAADFFRHPRKQEAHGLLGTTEHHLIYPGTIQERFHAEPAPMPFQNAFPEAFISQGYNYDPFIEHLYDCTAPYGAGTDFTHHVDRLTWEDGQFGNAIAFSARLMVQRLGDLPNFNLDGDRGYGWKTWRAQDAGHIESNNPVIVDYIDA